MRGELWINNVCIYIVPPPMYPRLSSQSRLWDGLGSWDALVSMPFSEKLQDGVR